MNESNMKAQYPTNKQLEPAFPHREYDSRPYYHGMSLRDYFAAAALAALIQAYQGELSPFDANGALRAYDFADAMLKARGEA